MYLNTSCVRESTAGGGRGNAAGGTSLGSSTLVPDRSSTPVATEYADDVAAEALGADDDASETDEPGASAPQHAAHSAQPQDNQHHDDAMPDRYTHHLYSLTYYMPMLYMPRHFNIISFNK